jgi:hypothetical protein
MRSRLVFIAMTLVAVLIGAGVVSAREIQQGDRCDIPVERTITGNLLVLCRTLTLEGHVTGNLIGAATSAIINGQVDGDVYMLAGQLDVGGTIGEDLHFAGIVMRVHPETNFVDEDSDLLTASVSTTIQEGAVVPGSVLGLGYQFLMQGEVGGEMSFWGSSLTLDGTMGGDVDAEVGDANADVSQLQTLLIPFPVDITLVRPGLYVTDKAHVNGQLTYSGPSEAEIPAGALAQDPIFTPVVVQPNFTTLGEQDQSRGVSIYITQVVREFFTLGVIGFLGLLVIPRGLQTPLRSLQARPLACLGVGLLAFIVYFVAVPFAILLSLLLIFAISLLQVSELTFAVGTILGVLDIGGSSILFFIVIFVSRVIICLAIGRAVTRALLNDGSTGRAIFLSLLIGVILLALVASLPVVGWVINALALFLGLGAILTYLQAQAETVREAAPPQPRYANVSVSAPALPTPRPNDQPRLIPPPPPPILEDSPRPLGMDNLPDGFKWWDDDYPD